MLSVPQGDSILVWSGGIALGDSNLYQDSHVLRQTFDGQDIDPVQQTGRSAALSCNKPLFTFYNKKRCQKYWVIWQVSMFPLFYSICLQSPLAS